MVLFPAINYLIIFCTMYFLPFLSQFLMSLYDNNHWLLNLDMLIFQRIFFNLKLRDWCFDVLMLITDSSWIPKDRKFICIKMSKNIWKFGEISKISGRQFFSKIGLPSCWNILNIAVIIRDEMQILLISNLWSI